MLVHLGGSVGAMLGNFVEKVENAKSTVNYRISVGRRHPGAPGFSFGEGDACGKDTSRVPGRIERATPGCRRPLSWCRGPESTEQCPENIQQGGGLGKARLNLKRNVWQSFGKAHSTASTGLRWAGWAGLG